MNRKVYSKPALTDFGDIPSITRGGGNPGGDGGMTGHVNCDMTLDMGGMDGTADGFDSTPIGCVPRS